MYLQRYDDLVKERCKHLKPNVFNNRDILFQSPAQKFSNIYNDVDLTVPRSIN